MTNTKWQNHFETYQSFIRKFGAYNILKYIHRFADRNDIILDFGCGKGDDAIGLYNEKFYNIEAYDVTNIFFKYKNKIKFNLSKNGSLSVLNNDYYDVIYASGVFHHIHEPIKTLDDLKNKLKKNGKLIVIEPRDSILRSLSEYLLFYTPLKFIFSNLVKCLKEEWPTYEPWKKLYSNDMLSLMKKINLEIILINKTIFNVEVVCKKK